MFEQNDASMRCRKTYPDVRATRLDTRMRAVGTPTNSPWPTVTALGRALHSATSAKRSIKRIDRLAGNRHLRGKAPQLTRGRPDRVQT